MEKAVVPISPAKHLATSATTGGRGHKTQTALTAASPMTSHGSHTGPKAALCNRIADRTAASTIIAATAHRPSQLDLRRHAPTPPIPTSAAMPGARAPLQYG